MLANQSADFYLDMRQFSGLERAARAQDAGAAKRVAQQFEGLFLQMILKDMRSAARFDESQHSSNLDFYQEMYDRQLAQTLARNGGIGIADLLERQINPASQGANESRQAPAGESGKSLPAYRMNPVYSDAMPLARMDYQAVNPAVQAYRLEGQPSARHNSPTAALGSTAVKPFFGWQAANEFVHDLLPHAREAADVLGVSPELLVAQSALETGWGQHTMKKADGSVAFSLFGIKAGPDWQGQRVAYNTLEFRAGAMQQEQAWFRAYDSVADAMTDYVDFVRSRAHYADALSHQGQDEHYIRALHAGGYATDPDYADKVINIVNGTTLQQALSALTPGVTATEASYG